MGGIEQFIPLILIFAIMYFLMIRPQQKKIKEHQKMVQNLRRGDVVVTQGGLIGKVAKVKENNELDLELAEVSRCALCNQRLRMWFQKLNLPAIN